MPERYRPLVLVVEDLPETYELYSNHLAAAGFQVIGAGDGLEGVRAAERLLPDIILMDLSLPLLNGCEAAARLTTDARTRHIPILAVTAHDEAVLDAAVRDHGCAKLLRKPCPLDVITAELRHLLASTGLPLGAPSA